LVDLTFFPGYSTGIRAHEQFTFKIPDAIDLEQAAPMLCGGLTAYSPLVRNGCGPGKKVGVVGIVGFCGIHSGGVLIGIVGRTWSLCYSMG